MSATTVVFSASGTIQTYLVPVAGTYVIEAAGGQGGAGASPGLKGARVGGMFYLKRGDLVKIVAGRRGTPGIPPQSVAGRGGDSLVWTGPADLPQPVKLMLCARGGKGTETAGIDPADATGGSGGSHDHAPAAHASGPAADRGDVDPLTIDTLATQWTCGTESITAQPARDAARIDRAGYNAGSFRTSTPEVQEGDGYVSITPVTLPASSHPADHAPADSAANELAPAGGPAVAGVSGSAVTGTPPASPADQGSEVPSQTMLPPVTPRPGSWADLLRQRRRPGTK